MHWRLLGVLVLFFLSVVGWRAKPIIHSSISILEMITAPRIKKSPGSCPSRDICVDVVAAHDLFVCARFQKNKSIDEHRGFADFPGFSSDAASCNLYGKEPWKTTMTTTSGAANC